MLERIDGFQRRHPWLGLPLAVVYKFVDDRGPYLAAIITYYALVSLFPLLLLLVTALGFLTAGNDHIRQLVLTSALRDFPVVGTQIRENVNGLTGGGTALAVGIVGTLYGGIGVTQAAQAAFNRIYGVPRNEQPNPVTSRIRGLLLLLLLGAGVLATTVTTIALSSAGVLTGDTSWVRPVAQTAALGLNVVLFSVAFQLLVSRRLAFRRVVVGGSIAGGLWYLLQRFGAAYLTHQVAHSRELYGTFGLVLGIVAWLYLEALVVVLAAEINVTLHERLWPRALLTPFTDDVDLTEADHRAYRKYAGCERYKGFERVVVSFDGRPPVDTATPAGRRGVEMIAAAGEPSGQ